MNHGPGNQEIRSLQMMLVTKPLTVHDSNHVEIQHSASVSDVEGSSQRIFPLTLAAIVTRVAIYFLSRYNGSILNGWSSAIVLGKTSTCLSY